VTPVIACSGEGGGLLGLVQRRDVPDPQRVVQAAADDPLPVRAETHAADMTRVSLECARLQSGFGIPDLNRVVIAAALLSTAMNSRTSVQRELFVLLGPVQTTLRPLLPTASQLSLISRRTVALTAVSTALWKFGFALGLTFVTALDTSGYF
jgi:hypothetical protein